ncbi:site-specific integrase [Oryzomonas rubra]|uniref:Site-specific integrase n=1 Tax=Oryzomonas rubra TaxID=2509454 RepID=A0A5A9X666_9BACT|nr:site-specific integrase [Oryzomonas rubra]KAA0888143.1 site-specific integrase [Oryzomonas rubra]
MVTEKCQEQHECIRKMIAEAIKEDHKAIEREELKDLEEEAEIEIFKTVMSKAKPNIRSGIRLPTDDTIATWNPDGSPLSYFGDPEWSFWLGYSLNTIRFGHVHKDLGLDLSSELCKPLVSFHKIICFFQLPGNNPSTFISSYASVMIANNSFLHLSLFLKGKGYLYGVGSEYLGLATLSIDTLRKELSRCIAGNETQRVKALSKAISLWINVSTLVNLPPEFAAPFSATQFWGSGFKENVYKYIASQNNPWDTIVFDDLVKMFETTKNYIDNYTDDILFIGNIYDDLISDETLRDKRGDILQLNNSGATKHLKDRVMERKYAINLKTGEAWLKPSLVKGRVPRLPFRAAIENMRDVCIFLLFIWTGMRLKELTTLKTTALTVNGKPLDQNQGALEQVRRGNHFTLTRMVTKTTKNRKGEKKPVPLPRSAAEAFAILVDLCRKGRQQTGNTFLLPHGDFGYARGVRFEEKRATFPVSTLTIYTYFRNFCDLAGVTRYHPHRCRKTIATILINHDPKCIELVRDLLCHNDIQMTRKYLMSLPGIAKETRKLYVVSQFESLTEILTSAIEGKLAGAAGDRASMAIADNIEAFKGKRLAKTIAALEETLIESNFMVVRTPVSWCLRFESRIPWDAPCLPPPEKRRTGEIAVPNFDKCDDWQCKYSGYTSSDLRRLKQRRSWAQKMTSKAVPDVSRAYYESIVAHWDRIIDHLENGRLEIVGLHLPEAFLAQAGAHS